MASKKQVTLGMDPEFFVRDRDSKQVVPICGIVGGDKGNAKPFPSSPSQYGYLEDGVALEVNCSYAASASSFHTKVMSLKLLVEQLLLSYNLEPVYGFSTYKFSNRQLESKQAQTLGCDPDMCAYGTLDDGGEWLPVARPKLTAADLGNYRHVGGHLHFGYDKDLIPDHVMAQLIDTFVYLPVLPHDKQTGRRPLYGLAGLYRSKDYGIEYRSMSNFWFDNKTLTESRLTLDYAIARNSFNLMTGLVYNQELMAEVYSELPLSDVKAMIDSGVDSTNHDKWESLTASIQKLRSVRSFGNLGTGV